MASRKVSTSAPADNASMLVVEVPEIKLSWLSIELIGESPLLTNRFSDTAKKSIEAKQQGKAAQTKPPRNPEAEFVEACYKLPAPTDSTKKIVGDRYGFRAIAIKKAMVTAGFRFATGKGTQLNGAFFVDGPHSGFVEILGPKPKMQGDMVVLKGMSKVASIAYRPYFFPWRMIVEVKYIPNFITRDQLLNLAILAGQCVSLGSWRVEKGGDKGLYRVGEVKDVRRAA